MQQRLQQPSSPPPIAPPLRPSGASPPAHFSPSGRQAALETTRRPSRRPRVHSNAYQRIAFGPLDIPRHDLIAALEAGLPNTVEPDGTDPHSRIRSITRRLRECCRNPLVCCNPDTGEIGLAEKRCRSRLCPRCGRLRAAALERELLQRVRKINCQRFITLTLRSTDAPLREQLQRLTKAFAKLRRAKAGRAHITGGLYTLECTWNPKARQWHPHLHALVDGSYWRQQRLSEAWLKATGDSSVVDIRFIRGQREACKYLAKYVAKTQTPTNVPPGRIREWADAVHGLRFVSAFGNLHGAKVDAEEREANAPLETTIELSQLIHDADEGVDGALPLIHAIRTAARNRFHDDPSGTPSDTPARNRDLIGRLRDWMQSRHEDYHDPPPPRPTSSPPDNLSGHRSLRLWEDNDPPPPARRY